jgi:polar amino acid transport system substrate-binding protein
MPGWRGFCAAAAPLVCVAVIAGCGSSNNTSSSSSSSGSGGASASSSSASGSSSPSTKSDAKVVALVPSAAKSKGTITVASDATYAPNEFIASDGKTVIGMDADMMKALAGLMGLKIKIVNATFDSIIPGLAAGKYDVGASSFTDTKERQKTVDFVDYFIAGESFLTKAQGGVSINGLADLCGHTVAVERGTTEQADAQKQSTKCKSAGKPAVTVLPFADQNGANLALSSGRAQLGFADSPVAEYQVKKSNGQFKLVGPSLENAPYGLAISKTGGLAKPMLAALKVLVDNGQYKAILTHWGVQAGAIPPNQVKLNGAAS